MPNRAKWEAAKNALLAMTPEELAELCRGKVLVETVLYPCYHVTDTSKVVDE